ncbi:metallopeptidase ImmA [Oxobacter pfennigii]|uniref:Metallopeptidase ImmA n=1 Tax=Oxobacter pfennigii TaxID=36849 RepID=A0A0P8WDG7_9CLOT|nr:ImmA/IrrE family metallo-endopeptidase [Oxobacter pfennigii]KPU45805.1 metallopeptidase ImmA [Oxobacter pfennigii]
MIDDIIVGLLETYNTNNPFELCDFLDIKIISSNLGSDIKGFFQRTEEGYEIIHINSTLDYNESKYICAHELGHAILHTDLSISFFIENSLQIKNKFEIQADIFAAELLISNEQVDLISITDMTMDQLSSYFRVPADLIKYKFSREV